LRLLCWFVCVHTAYCACDYVISLPWSPSLVPEFLDWYMVSLRQDNSASIAHALVRWKENSGTHGSPPQEVRAKAQVMKLGTTADCAGHLFKFL